MKRIDVLITGVGGQGNILASDIIGEAAVDAGYDVKKTDTLGMAQRGGSVVSNIRIAQHVYSPLIKEGEVDILLAFEKLEAARWAHYLRQDGIAIVNNQTLPPLSVSLGNEQYPSDEAMIKRLRQRTDHIYIVEGTQMAQGMGNMEVLNIFMLGCVAVFLPFKVQSLKNRIAQHLPATVHEINLTAFDHGRKEIRNAHI